MIDQEECVIPIVILDLKSSCCDFSDAYLLVKQKKIITGAGADVFWAERHADETNNLKNV